MIGDTKQPTNNHRHGECRTIGLCKMEGRYLQIWIPCSLLLPEDLFTLNKLVDIVRNLVRKNMFSKQVLHCDCFHSGTESTCRAPWQPSQNAKQIFEQLKNGLSKKMDVYVLSFSSSTPSSEMSSSSPLTCAYQEPD